MSHRRPVTRLALAAAGLVATLALAGAAYQAIGDARDRRTLHPSGQLIDIGRATLHLDCRGTGSPTVVLEAGATGFAGTWAWIQPELARGTRVCAYDRAGLGWSTPSDAPRDAATIAAELHDALAAAGERGPYVLAGHSLGGPFVRVFAARYPGEVAGVVLVDPSHPDQRTRIAKLDASMTGFVRTLRVAGALAHVGLPRATGLLAATGAALPADAFAQGALFMASPAHLAVAAAELEAWDASMAQTRAAASLGALPLVVVSAADWRPDGAPADGEGTHALHAELATLSSRGRHVVVPEADHLSLVLDARHAPHVVRAIAAVVDEARAAR